MTLNGLIYQLPKEAKLLIGVFVFVLSIGFFTGISFVGNTTNYDSKGIEEQYLGNEADEDALVMKFKKNEKQVLTLIHNHILSLSVIFFLLGVILLLTDLPLWFKKILIIEPFVSLILTFGGLYFLWKELLWMKYIVIFSGVLLTLCYCVSVAIIYFQLLKKKTAK